MCRKRWSPHCHRREVVARLRANNFNVCPEPSYLPHFCPSNCGLEPHPCPSSYPYFLSTFDTGQAGGMQMPYAAANVVHLLLEDIVSVGGFGSI